MLNVDKKILKHLEKNLVFPNTKDICALIFDAVKSNTLDAFDYKNLVNFSNKTNFEQSLLKPSLSKIYKLWWDNFVIPKQNQLKNWVHHT